MNKNWSLNLQSFKCLILILLTILILYAEDNFDAARKAMVEEIAEDTRDTSYYINKKELNPRVMTVMGKVPRHKFVPDNLQGIAYRNRPLPIGHGQTYPSLTSSRS